MVVLSDPNSFSGIFSGNTLSVNINFLELKDIKIKVDNNLLTDQIDYTATAETNDRELLKVYSKINIVFSNSYVNALYEITNDIKFTQQLNYSSHLSTNTTEIEYSLDKTTIELQSLKASVEKDLGVIKDFPDLTFQGYGSPIVTDGAGTLDLFPLRFPAPSTTDDGKILGIDFQSKRMKYIDPTGSENPSIPQPNVNYRPLMSDNNSYKLGVEEPILTQSDSDKVLKFDGSKFVAVAATGLHNPTIPSPPNEGLVLKSTNDSGQITTAWLPNQAINTSTSSGVVSGLKLTIKDTTSVNIESGVIQIVEEIVTSNPTIELISVPPYDGIQIPTTNGTTSYLYITVDLNGVVSVSVESTYMELPRGRKIFLADISHTHNNEITNISTDYTFIPSTAYQLKTFMQESVGNIARNVQLKPISTSVNQLEYSAGTFHGYNCNVNSNNIFPHVVNIAASPLISFRWRNQIGVDSIVNNTINTDNLMYELSPGVLVAVSNGKWTNVLVWVYPSGDVIFQYGIEEATSIGDLDEVDVFLTKIPKDPNMLKHAAPIGVLKLKQGGDFTNNHEIVNLVNFNVGGSGNSGLGLPIVAQTDINKVLVVNSTGVWAPSNYKLPIPTSGDEGKILTVISSNYELDNIPQQEDDTARTWFTSGVLTGFAPASTNVDKLNIPAGTACFMDESEGAPTNFTRVSFVGVTDYILTGIGAYNATYISFTKAGVLVQSEIEPTSIRGDSILLYKVDHSNNTTIDQIRYLFYVQNSVAAQIKELWGAVGSSIEGLEIISSGAGSLKHNSGIFKGFDVGLGAGQGSLDPHRKNMAPLDPIPFEFRTSLDVDSSTFTVFPTVPKIEATAGVLTNLITGHVAFYPVWLFDTNRLILQYATEQYSTSGTIPTLPELALSFSPSISAREFGVFVGFVGWEFGKDFSNGSKFLPFNLLGGVASSGGSGLPKSTPADTNRIYQVDEHGLAGLGVKIQRPVAGEFFSDRIVTTNAEGDILFTAPSTTPPTLSGLPNGDFFLASRSGVISAITNRTPYVQSSGIPAEDSHLYSVRPAPIEFTNKGLFLSKFSLNNSGGGEETKLKLSDVWKYEGYTGKTNEILKGINPAVPQTQAMWDLINPRIIEPASNSDVRSWLEPKENGIKVVSEQGKSCPQNSIIDESLTSSTYIRVTSSGSTISLNESAIDDITFSLRCTTYLHSTNASTFWIHGNSVYVSFSIPKDPTIKIQLEIISLQEEPKPFLHPTIPKCVIVTSSSSPIEGNPQMEFPLSGYATITPIGLKTTINGIDPSSTTNQNLYHRPNTAATDDLFYVGFGVPVDYIDHIRNNPNTYDTRDLTLKVKMNITKGGGAGELFNFESRYEYITLKQIRDLVGHPITAPIPSTGFDPIFEGAAPTITPGKITVFLWVLFPRDVKKLEDYDQSHGGIVINEFDRNDVPMCFLEEQSGTTVYTNRLEGKRRFAKSRLVESYDFDCTQDQFDNWKLVFYFRTKVSEQVFKSNADELGASVWIVNSDDIPE